MNNEKTKFRSIQVIFSILSSKAFLLWMTGGWITYYVMTSIWMDEAFGSFAVGIGKNPFIQIPFITFLITGYLNLLRASICILRKGKIQFIAWSVLPLGTLLFFTGFFLSLLLRESGQRIIGEGDIIKPPWVRETLNVKDIQPGLKDRLRNTDADTSIFSQEPELTLTDKNSESYRVGVFPPVIIDATYYHILDFGIAPDIKLLRGGRLMFEGYQPLRILTPGQNDFFEIPSFPYRFLISMAPEKSFQKGKLSVSDYNFQKPVYRARVYKGEKIIAEGNSGQGISFDNFTLYFEDHTFWAMLEAAKDPGLPVLRLSLLLIIIGIPLSFARVFYNTEIKDRSK
ncbi:MAG: hypothetical protein ABFR82_13025 [Nitrospirota bacterium]